MRGSLEIIERVEMYLSGKLSSQENSLFEMELAHSPELKEMVENQELIQQVIRRKAILKEIELYAPNFASSLTFWDKFKWPIILSTGLLLVATSLFIVLNKEDEPEPMEPQSSNYFIPVQTENDNSIQEKSIAEEKIIEKTPELPTSKTSTKSKVNVKSKIEVKSNPTSSEGNLIAKDEKKPVLTVDHVINSEPRVEVNTNQKDQIENWIVQPIFDSPDVPASFPNGKRGISKFISENVRYPESAIESNIQGQVDVKFIVDENGQICDAEAMNSNPERLLLEMEAIRLIESMPPWIPAENNGAKVKSWVKVPVNFILK